jgi:hypothetical protein
LRSEFGGWGGIRTHETLASLPVFKTGAFNRSTTHPARVDQILNLSGRRKPMLAEVPARQR